MYARLLPVDNPLGDGANKTRGIGWRARRKSTGGTELQGGRVYNHDLIGDIGDDTQVMGNHDDGTSLFFSASPA